MTPDPSELSAFLDGELSAVRAREVEAWLAADPTLRAEFDGLSREDAAWHSAARTAVFQPRVRLPKEAHLTRNAERGAAAIIVLISLWMLPKIHDGLALGFYIHAVALGAILAGVLWLARTGEAPTQF